jgi:tRNA G37 N-methylase TrmD
MSTTTQASLLHSFTPSLLQKCTISLTPRGFPLNQQIVEWLANFQELNILCGRYEGFDARVSEAMDLELSVGNFVLNGGEVAAMSLIEAVSRLVPGFISKTESVAHDSFSSGLNYYQEQEEFVIGKTKTEERKRLQDQKPSVIPTVVQPQNLFDDTLWRRSILPYIEHPQYTRPEIWNNWKVPEVLLSGNHRKVQDWRRDWYKTKE